MSHTVDNLTSSPTSAAVPSTDEQTTRACLSLNKETMLLLENIRKQKGLSRCDAARMVIDAFRTGELSESELKSFYGEVWSKRPRHSVDSTPTRLDWSKDLDDYLLALALKLLGSANRSEGFRILVTCYALKKNISRVEWVSFPSFPPTDPADKPQSS